MEQVDTERSWLAVYTKPRNEKKVDQRLHNAGLECYCPVQKVLRQWSDRKKLISQPLFTSYVFVRVSESERLKVLKVSGVVRFVFWLGKPAIIPDHEIFDIKQFLEEYSTIKVNMFLNPGDLVLVNAGPLKNYRGIVVDTKRSSAILSLDSIGFQLMAEVNKNRISIDN